MPGKMARSAPRPPFWLPDALVTVLTSRLSCRKAGNTGIFTPDRVSSGESRFRANIHAGSGVIWGIPDECFAARGTFRTGSAKMN